MLRELEVNIRTGLTFANSIRRMSLSGERPTTAFWDEASNDRVQTVIDVLSDPQDEERRHIRRILGELGVESVLDAGCGPATENQSYKLNGPLREAKYVGLDLSQRMLRVARNRFPDSKFVRGNLNKLPFVSKSFDAVVLKHVLEHQPEGYGDVIKEAVRVAKKAVVVDLFHAPLGFGLPDIKIVDHEGFANYWYGRNKLEDFFASLPLAYFDRVKCKGGSGQSAVIYTLVK